MKEVGWVGGWAGGARVGARHSAGALQRRPRRPGEAFKPGGGSGGGKGGRGEGRR